jgi:hypothetical protein
MRRAASLQPHRAARLLAEKRFELPATKLFLKDDLALGAFAVDLKNRLGQIETDRDSVHVDGSYRWLANRNNDQLGTSMPSGAVHPALRAKRSNPDLGIAAAA